MKKGDKLMRCQVNKDKVLQLKQKQEGNFC